MIKKIWKVRIFLAWFNFWVGFYYDREHKHLYICPLPMVVIHVWSEQFRQCVDCLLQDIINRTMKKVAHNTGDGWALAWICSECEDYLTISWPFGDNYLSAKDLVKHGYEIV